MKKSINEFIINHDVYFYSFIFNPKGNERRVHIFNLLNKKFDGSIKL